MIPAKKCSRTKDFFRFYNGHIRVVYVCILHQYELNLHDFLTQYNLYSSKWTNRMERSLPTKYQETTEQETSGSFQLDTSQATTTAWITLLLKSSALSITSTTRPRSLETRPGTSQSPPFATLPILSWIFLSSVPSFAATCS